MKNNTCPSLKKAIHNLKINLSNNLKIEIPTKNKSRKSDLKNEDKEKSNESHTEKNSTITDENTHNDNNNAKIAKNSTKSKKRNLKKTSDYLDVMALIAIMEPATESQIFSRNKLPLKSRPSNKI